MNLFHLVKLSHIYKSFFHLAIVAIYLHLSFSLSYSLSQVSHSADMVELIHEGNSNEKLLFRSIAKEINSTIDNFQVIDDINSIFEKFENEKSGDQKPIRRISKGKHRIYGHWGFAGDIPKSAFDEFYKRIDEVDGLTFSEKEKLKSEVKNVIIDAWKNDVNKISAIIESGFPKLANDPNKIKGLAGLLYDIHIFGDFTTSDVDSLLSGRENQVKNLKINLERDISNLLGRRSASAIDLSEALNSSGKYEVLGACLMLDNKSSRISCTKDVWKEIKDILGSSQYIKKQVGGAVALIDKEMTHFRNMKGVLGSGLSIALFRNFGDIRSAFNGEKDWVTTSQNLAIDTLGYGSSVKIVNAVVINTGEKYAILSWLPKFSNKIGGEFAVAMFLFDGGKIGVSYLNGEISRDDFSEKLMKDGKESVKNIVALSIAVAISPAGLPVIIGFFAPVVGAIILVEGFDELYLYYEEHRPLKEITLLDIEHMFQISFKDNFTPWKPPIHLSPWEVPANPTPWASPANPTPW